MIDNIDPQQIGRVLVQVPDVLGRHPSSWAMPCVPAAGIQAGVFIVPPIGSQVWVEFEQGDPDYPIWTGGFWGIGRRGSGLRHGAARHSAGPEHRAADHRPEHDAGQRRAAHAGDRRHRAQERQRRHDRGQRDRHLHQQRTGRDDHLIGPTVAINETVTDRRRLISNEHDRRYVMPGPILHMGATVLCSHGGQAMPTAPSPVVLVSGMPIATIAAPYASPAAPSCRRPATAPASPGSGSWARRSVHVARPAGRHHDRRLDLRAHRNAAAAGVGPDPGSLAT